jgi:ABC-2 type transport system permease protein
MSKTLIIAKRELTSLFYSPVAYVALVVFSFIASLLFLATFAPGQPASMRLELVWIVWLLVFIAPAISMRVLSEEMQAGTLELLMTSPVTEVHIVVGKWLGAMGFFLTLLIPLVIHVAILEATANPDYGPILTGLLGVILVGGLYLAIGTWVSSWTKNQFIALLLTIVVTGFLTIGLYLLAQWQRLPADLQQALFYINVDRKFEGFSKGLIDVSDLIYFLSGIALFLFLAVLVLQSRRWR